MTGHRTYLDKPRVGIRTERNNDLIKRVLEIKRKGHFDEVRVTA